MSPQIHQTYSSLGLDLFSDSPIEGPLEDKRQNSGEVLVSYSPATGKPIASVRQTSLADYNGLVDDAKLAFQEWRVLPAPTRGEFIRRIGCALRDHKKDLGSLVAMESGKILSEGEGEVQEMIDIADFAVGLSRQLYGLTMHSERASHRMYEQWQPLGPIGIITAFNFPVAVWAWNAMIAAVCGDTAIWKPSEKTPMCALAIQNIVNNVRKEMDIPEVFFLACGGQDIGNAIAEDHRIPMVSATGSCRMGRQVGPIVAQRMGRSLLELGGNNASIILEDADMDLALRACVFAAVGTAGQRCTTLRRAIVEESIAGEFTQKLKKIYAPLSHRIGDPLDPKTLVGPLIDDDALKNFEKTIETIKSEGGDILVGGQRVDPKTLPDSLKDGFFVQPTLVKAHAGMSVIREETFAPILYLIHVSSLDEAIQIHNSVDQGLSSSIFTKSIESMEQFLGASGSDCGIANVNIGTSGAEIGGAFGGEKDTGGGREAGSDSWKAYMRRQTCTINWGKELPLAQGVEFDV